MFFEEHIAIDFRLRPQGVMGRQHTRRNDRGERWRDSMVEGEREMELPLFLLLVVGANCVCGREREGEEEGSVCEGMGGVGGMGEGR